MDMAVPPSGICPGERRVHWRGACRYWTQSASLGATSLPANLGEHKWALDSPEDTQMAVPRSGILDSTVPSPQYPVGEDGHGDHRHGKVSIRADRELGKAPRRAGLRECQRRRHGFPG